MAETGSLEVTFGPETVGIGPPGCGAHMKDGATIGCLKCDSSWPKDGPVPVGVCNAYIAMRYPPASTTAPRFPIPVVETKVMLVVRGRTFNADQAHEADRYAFAMSIADALQAEFGSSQHPDNWRDAAEFIVDNFNIKPSAD